MPVSQKGIVAPFKSKPAIANGFDIG